MYAPNTSIAFSSSLIFFFDYSLSLTASRIVNSIFLR